MSLLDCAYRLDTSVRHESASASAAAAVSETVSTTSVAAALETSDPANAVVLVASSWPPAVSSNSSDFDAVEPVALQFTVTCKFGEQLRTQSGILAKQSLRHKTE